MRLTRLVIVPAAAGALVLVGMSAASAGEVTGNGKPTQGPGPRQLHLRLLRLWRTATTCRPAHPPAPAHRPRTGATSTRRLRAAGMTSADIKASGFQPGDSCNGHSGFLAGGGEEP